ncbi:YraN family protein [Patescibacteria group bacterium]
MIAKTEKRRIGDIGERLAAMFLVKHGFQIIGRNYQKKWGELDIIAQKNGLLHFIEVKTISLVSRATLEDIRFIDRLRKPSWKIIISSRPDEVSHETLYKRGETDDEKEEYLPEENVHYWKQKRIIRAIQTYLDEKNVNEDQEWQIDIIAVKLDFQNKTAIIRHTDDVVFEV